MFDYKAEQVRFLKALAKLEERTSDGLRRIDVEETFAQNTVNDAKEILKGLMKDRMGILLRFKNGTKKYNSETLRAIAKERCKKDIIWWINNFCWILNPHLTKWGFPVKLPFILYPKQEEYILWRENLYKTNKSGVVYKCREVGASWLNVTAQAWHWFFEPGYQGRMGSLKAEEVDDKNDPDSLFQKLRVIIYNNPRWLRPKGFEDENNKYDTIMKLVNPENGAVISGQQGDNLGRGGRSAVFDIDEWAKHSHDKLVDSNLSMNTPCRIYTSTPIGRDNDFAEKVRSGKLPIFSFDYWDDPRKSKDWFENFSEQNSEEVVQQEVLKSFDAYKSGTAIPGEWVAAAVTLYSRIKKGGVAYTPDKRVAALDVAAGGKNKSAFLWRNGICIEEEIEWDFRNTTIIARRAGSETESRLCEALNYDPIAVGTGVRSTFELENYSFRAVPVDARRGASDIPLEGDTRPARERCLNRRAELMERVRRRFENTYEYITKDIQRPIESMIAINPDCQRTIAQLPVFERFVRNAKIRLQSKDDLVQRGLESPDFFDATMLCFADEVGDVKVVNKFNPLKECIETEIIPVKSLSIHPNYQHYISIYHTDGLKAGVIGAIWDGHCCTVYNELDVSNTSIPTIVSAIRAMFPVGVVSEYVGNSKIFREGEDDLFIQYLSAGIMIQENFLFNELASVALLNEMFARGGIKIYKKCMILLRQVEGFTREKGVPDMTNMHVVMALCNLVNRLKSIQTKPVQEPEIVHYGRKVKVTT